jgi:hypothetical protein
MGGFTVFRDSGFRTGVEKESGTPSVHPFPKIPSQQLLNLSEIIPVVSIEDSTVFFSKLDWLIVITLTEGFPQLGRDERRDL